ncbi:DUF2057 family protein [Marinobacter sp. VGCF2001]|uniref:DUF2057 family protein n=1 Tax=Marinobacter sp. VGCF2001 TaxID=3417189 RepID=UPI003CEE8BEF
MAGCASSLARIDTWEGQLPAEVKPAVLQAPGAIQVVSVNGRSMTNFLVEDLALDYGLQPGANEVVFSYKTIWAKTGVVRDGESKVHVIDSGRQVARFEARPDTVYRFDFEKPESRRAAEAMSENFSARIVAADGTAVATSEAWDGQSRLVSERTPLPASEAGTASSAGETAGTALDRLKSVWVEASDEEKKAFLRWAFE